MKKQYMVAGLLWWTSSGLMVWAGENKLAYPNIDDPTKEWCYLARSITQTAMPFVPNTVQVTWDGDIYTRQRELSFFYGQDLKPVMQREKNWLEGWIPVVEYDWTEKAIHYKMEIFNANLDGENMANTVTFARATVRNAGSTAVETSFAAASRGSAGSFRYGKPPFDFTAEYEIKDNALFYRKNLAYVFPAGATSVEAVPGVPYQKAFKGSDYFISPRCEVGLARYDFKLNPGEVKTLEFKIPSNAVNFKTYVEKLLSADFSHYYTNTVAYWRNLLGDKCVLDVPEPRVQKALKASAMHVILGTRGNGNGTGIQTDGLPYGGLFISAGFDYDYLYDVIGLPTQVIRTYDRPINGQDPDGLFADGRKAKARSHGQALMMLTHHIIFTGDMDYAKEMYPHIQKAVAYITTAHKADQYGLMPPSEIAYDNEMIIGRYTSHNLWCLAALRQSIVVARLLGQSEDAKNWLAVHDSYEKAVLKALEANAGSDGFVPPGLYGARGVGKEIGEDWENSLLAWPTELLAPDNRLVRGTMNRWRQDKYREGIMAYKRFLHHYVTVNAAQQDLVAGNQKQALLDIYHILLHCGSTMEGFENQCYPWDQREIVDGGAAPCHAWGSSKIAGLIRNMFVLEYGGKLGLEPDKRNLYLFSVVSPAWAKSGETISIRNAPTEFGTVSTSMQFTEGGAEVRMEKNFRTQPGQIVVRIPYFVKDVSFTSDAKTSLLKDNAVSLSSDASTLTLKWKMDPDADKTTYQDILLGYRREKTDWVTRLEPKPKSPDGSLTDAEKAHPSGPLSFQLVKEAFTTEYGRRYAEMLKNGGKSLTLEAPALLTNVAQKEALYKESLVEKNLALGKKVTASGNLGAARFVNTGKRGDLSACWEVDTARGPAWWQVDLEKVTKVGHIVVVADYREPAHAYPYTIEASVDGTNWNLLVDQRENKIPATRDGYSAVFAPTSMRFIKVTGFKNNVDSKFRLVQVLAD